MEKVLYRINGNYTNFLQYPNFASLPQGVKDGFNFVGWSKTSVQDMRQKYAGARKSYWPSNYLATCDLCKCDINADEEFVYTHGKYDLHIDCYKAADASLQNARRKQIDDTKIIVIERTNMLPQLNVFAPAPTPAPAPIPTPKKKKTFMNGHRPDGYYGGNGWSTWAVCPTGYDSGVIVPTQVSSGSALIDSISYPAVGETTIYHYGNPFPLMESAGCYGIPTGPFGYLSPLPW